MTQQQQPAEGDTYGNDPWRPPHVTTGVASMTDDTITVPDLRALDALVDQHVMEHPKFDAKECREVPGFVTDHWEYGPDGEGPFYCGPHYTTDPRDWMAVVEKMRGEGWIVDIGGRDDGNYEVMFDSGGTVPCPFAIRKDIGVAVCLAAVQAKTGKRVVLG